MDKISQNFLRETRVIECPKSVVGRVIGKNGETIKALQIYTGALIQIDQTMEPMNINITGTQPNLQLAVSMVYDIIHRNFKGFALLRQIATTSNTSLDLKGETYSNLPIYSPGYGFIPPSQTKRQGSPGLESLNLSKLHELETLQQLQALSQLHTEATYKNIPGINSDQVPKSINAFSQGFYSSGANQQKLSPRNQVQNTFSSSFKNMGAQSQPLQFSQELSSQNLNQLSQNIDLQKVQQDQLLQDQALNLFLGEQNAQTSNFLLNSLGEIPSRVSGDNLEASPFNDSPPNSSSNNTPPNEKWAVICDPDGKLFYFNQDTGETSWSNPFQQQQANPFNTSGIGQQLDMIFTNNKAADVKDTEILSAESQNSRLSGYSQF